MPGLLVTPLGTYIAFGAPREFAAVAPQATEIRIALALGDRPLEPGWEKPRIRGVGAPFTHMLVLTDARQVNLDFLSLIKESAALTNA